MLAMYLAVLDDQSSEEQFKDVYNTYKRLVYHTVLPASEVVASFFLFLEFSFVNGIYITCYRKATDRKSVV